MSQKYIPPQKRQRSVDSSTPEAPTTSTAEGSSKKLKLSTKVSSRTAATSSCTTAWCSGATRPSSTSSSGCSSSSSAPSTSPPTWGLGAAKLLFPSSTPSSSIRGPSPSSTSQSSSGSTSQPPTEGLSPPSCTTSGFPAWRSQSPTTGSDSSANSQPSSSSQSSASSQSSTSSEYSAAQKNVQSWRENVGASKLQSIAIGQICWLPTRQSVPVGEPILQHPIFLGDGAFTHPCLVVEDPDNKGYLKCFQTTAFSATSGGLLAKYKGPSKRAQRNRWLPIEHEKQAAHDDLPVLTYETDAHLPKASYINTEMYFKIKPEHLVLPSGKLVKLDTASVDIVNKHHYKHYHA